VFCGVNTQHRPLKCERSTAYLLTWRGFISVISGLIISRFSSRRVDGPIVLCVQSHLMNVQLMYTLVYPWQRMLWQRLRPVDRQRRTEVTSNRPPRSVTSFFPYLFIYYYTNAAEHKNMKITISLITQTPQLGLSTFK